MTRTDFDQWLAYSDACNRLLQETLNAAPQFFDTPFETESDFHSVREIFAHIVGSEERWIKSRIQGQIIPMTYEQRAADTIAGLFADAAQIRAETRAYLSSLTDADFEKSVELAFPRWNFQRTLTIAEIMFQILTHETYHRGQIAMTLQRQGVDTPNFDYVFLKPV